jgi:hypothetical protein
MKKTEIIVVMDRSGSMQGLVEDMEGGFKTFIDEQKKIEGEARVTLAQFDDQYDLVYASKPLANVDGVKLVPRNSTALYDAIGFTIAQQKARLEQEKWAELVVMVVITDGLENASKEYSQAAVKALVKDAEAKGWEFVYMGANQDAILVAEQHMGMKIGSGKNYAATRQGTQDMYMEASATTTIHRSK